MHLVNMLSPWQWALLAATPLAVIALYFLKLKREPLEVPSTFLWSRSIEDLRVNSLWQRLRQSLLLILQLLLIAIAAFALARPYWEGGRLSGGRYIFLIDNSASMSATDVAPSRLEEAKRRVGELIDEMIAGDKAMIISFSDIARAEQSYTDNLPELRRALAAIRQTSRGTSLEESLQLASGLANPSQTASNKQDKAVADPMPAKLYIFSDGRFPDVRGFSLGNLEPQFVPIGEPDAANIGIVSFTTGRNENHPEQLQAFARLESHGRGLSAFSESSEKKGAVPLSEDSTSNSSPKPANSDTVKINLSLYLDDKLIDSRDVAVPVNDAVSEAFDLGAIDQGVLRVAISPTDHLALDDQAWTVINPPRRAKVLFITSGNESLHRALTVPSAQKWADVAEDKPPFLKTDTYRQRAAAGAYDLIVFDRCQPELMPRTNTWFIGALPPMPTWSADDAVVQPQIIDTDRAHPIMQGIDLGDVEILEARPLKPPPASTRLLDSNKGTLMAIATRENFEDAVLSLSLLTVDGHGDTYANTDWPIKLSFPLLVSNLLQYFGHNQQAQVAMNARPGQPIQLHGETDAPLVVTTPTGEKIEAPRGLQQTINFAHTDALGVYESRHSGKVIQQFAVNLFDSRESDIRPRTAESVKIGYVEVKPHTEWEPARREIWKLLLLVALAVLLFEWYVYNRRVYL